MAKSVFRLLLIMLFAVSGAQAQALLPGAPAVAWTAALLTFWLMMSWQYLYRRHAGVVDSRWFPWLAWSGSICFGLWATFVMFVLPLDALAAVVRVAHGPSDFLREASRAALGAAALVTAVGVWQTLRGPILRQVSIPVDALHEDLDGLTIVQISDLHVGPTIRHRYVERVVRRALSAKPDLIAITGDLVDGHPQRLRAELASFTRLTAPLGVYYVTGNHEYYWGAERWIRAVTELGCTALIDRSESIRRGRAAILVAGVADPAARDFGAERGADIGQLADRDAAVDFRLLLAHRPGACDAAAAAGFDLQLSGHTHGGQFFPFNLLVRLTHRYHRGLVRLGRLWLYVSAGTGYWGPPHRFWIPAEVAVLRLRRVAQNLPEDSSSGA